MRILNASLVIILTLLSESFCFDLKCSVSETYWGRACNVYDLVITSSDDTITSVNGNPQPTEYSYLRIQNQKVKFVPKNIANFFPELVELEISNSSLEWIEQTNLRDLVHLKKLNLEKNELEILERNLFDYNTNLETINIRENKLKFINKDIFNKLTNLLSIDLQQNVCIQSTIELGGPDEDDFGRADYYRDHLVEQLNRYCQLWEDAYRVYERKFNNIINNLQSENKKLTHQLKTCDGNLDAALTNFHQQKLVNSNTIKSNEFLPVIKLSCEDIQEEEVCNAIDFKVSFANSSIESGYFKEKIITTLKIHQQQTLFLPQNLSEQFPMLNELLVIESGLYEIDYSVLNGLSLLITLNLTNNKLPEIPVDTFTDLEELQELDLSFNKIHTLYDGVFTNLKNLQKLYLNNNYVTHIKIEVLENLDNLTGLFLQNNLLKFISATLLTPLTSLESVDLSDNVCINMSHPTSSLKEVEATIIDNCIAPVELHCKMVQFQTDENYGNTCQAKDLFIEYPKTKISKVSGEDGANNSVIIFYADKQSINFFPYQLAQYFPNLERIEIQQSKLISLHQMDFDGFSKLAEIVMNNNNLSLISEGSFDYVPQLKLLDLSSNNIVSLPTKIFMKLTRLRTLLLTNNRIVKFTADFLPKKNIINVFRADNNQLEIIETKSLRFLRKATLIDLSGNICIDMKFDKNENRTRALVELSGEIDLNCSADD